MQRIDWGRMTAEDTAEAVDEGFRQLTEEVQMEMIAKWVDELGGPANFAWDKEDEHAG